MEERKFDSFQAEGVCGFILAIPSTLALSNLALTLPEASRHVTPIPETPRSPESRRVRSNFPRVLPTVSKTMNVFGRRILSTPRVFARLSSTTTVVPPHPPASATPTFATETAVSDYPQAPNHPGLWSENQRPRPTPATGPRFEQTTMQLQPQPLSAMELIAKEPIRLSKTRIAACDGGAYRAFDSHASRSLSLVTTSYRTPDTTAPGTSGFQTIY